MSRSYEQPCRQRGDILLESLIGIVLMAIVGLGLVHSAAKVAVSQKDMNEQNILVSQMRALLQERGQRLCSGSVPSIRVPPDKTVALVASCSNAPAMVTIGGDAIEVGSQIRWVSLSTTGDDPVVVGDRL